MNLQTAELGTVTHFWNKISINYFRSDIVAFLITYNKVLASTAHTSIRYSLNCRTDGALHSVFMVVNVRISLSHCRKSIKTEEILGV